MTIIDKNRYVAEKLDGFRVIPHFPDYAISELGVIVRLTKARGTYLGKKISIYKSADGYFKVTLVKDGKPTSRYLHEMVAAAFIGERPPDHQINHIDGKKENIHPSNLEYCTISENNKHAFRIGLNKPRDQRGSLNHRWKGGLRDLVCFQCGCSFERERMGSRVYSHDFCSAQCHWDHQKGKTIAERTAI